MRITRLQLRRIIREAIHDFDEDPYDDLLTALQGTFLGSPPREMDAAALAKVGEFYPDEAKELMVMSNNKLNNIIAMAWPTGY
jgi:hypothetical protein